MYMACTLLKKVYIKVDIMYMYDFSIAYFLKVRWIVFGLN